MTITDDELATHMQPLVDAGFSLNPEALTPLAAWNHILMQVIMASYYIKRLQNYESKLGDMEDAFVLNALFVAFLTTYAKCFVSAEEGAIKLDRKDVFKAHNSAMLTHDRIIELRHSYAAHNSSSNLVRTTMAAKEEVDRFLIKHLITTAIPGNEFESFANTVGLVENYVTERLNLRLDKLQAKLGKLIEIDNPE